MADEKVFVGSTLARDFPDGGVSITLGLKQADIEVLQDGLNKAIQAKGPEAFVNISTQKGKTSGKWYSEIWQGQFKTAAPSPASDQAPAAAPTDLPF